MSGRRASGGRSRRGYWKRSRASGRSLPASSSNCGAPRPKATRIRRPYSKETPARRVWKPSGWPTWSGYSRKVGFSAAKIIRRILGLAHNIDFEWIEDPKRRAISEARSLRLARAMMVDAASFRTIGAVTKAAQEARDWEPEFAK